MLKQRIVFSMRANSKPEDTRWLTQPQCSIMDADTHGINRLTLANPFELKARVVGFYTPKCICMFCLRLRIHRERLELFAEALGNTGFHDLAS